MRKEKEKILKEVLRLLGEKYPIGLYEYLYKRCPDLYNELILIEHDIDRSFLSDSVSIDEFKAILRDYWKLHMIAIREYKKADQLNFNLPKAREEMIEERIRA